MTDQAKWVGIQALVFVKGMCTRDVEAAKPSADSASTYKKWPLTLADEICGERYDLKHRFGNNQLAATRDLEWPEDQFLREKDDSAPYSAQNMVLNLKFKWER